MFLSQLLSAEASISDVARCSARLTYFDQFPGVSPESPRESVNIKRPLTKGSSDSGLPANPRRRINNGHEVVNTRHGQDSPISLRIFPIRPMPLISATKGAKCLFAIQCTETRPHHKTRHVARRCSLQMLGEMLQGTLPGQCGGRLVVTGSMIAVKAVICVVNMHGDVWATQLDLFHITHRNMRV